MTTIHCHTYSFVPATEKENTTDIVFSTEDNIPHQSEVLYPPYHFTRSGEEPVEFLVRVLRSALDYQFVSYITLAPRITSHDYQIISSDNLNASSFRDNAGINIVSTILVSGQPQRR